MAPHDISDTGKEGSGGQPLDTLLGAPMDPGSLVRLAIGVTEALAELHKRNIIHKNVKPHSILVDPRTGDATLTDFSIASRVPYEYPTVKAMRKIEGTLAYMSPEQTGRMNRVVDYRTDLYSLGVTFYEMLTGMHPFQAGDALEWVHCHIARMPRPPADIIPAIPQVVSDIVMKLLAKTAEERYQTALGLKFDLKRCLEQWEARRDIYPFALGEGDISDRLLIPQKLYGREKDIETLLCAFDRVVERGTPELVMVAGYSGIGKTSLVRELYKPIVRDRGLFISGKFDQFKRDIPYSTMVEAFRGLIRHILIESEQRIADWKQQLQGALGVNGQIIVEVIPQVELIIGKQPPVPELPPTEAQNRFKMVFRQFMGVFTKKEHPLVVFLDDLQWVDSASLKLLEHIITHPDTRYLLLIGAYRDNEVGPSHPLMSALDDIGKGQAILLTITVSPLSFEDLGRLVADTFRSDERRVEPLTRLVYEKTAGNPFFVIQFLVELYGGRQVKFDSTERLWKWEIARIRAKGFTDNVVDLMVGKLRRLSAGTRQALRLAACIGNTFDLHTLAVIGNISDEDTEEVLHEALQEGMVLRLTGSSYAFLHDRVQQAAYSLIPEEQRSEMHLRTGWLLLAHTSPEGIEDQVFDIVNQLNLGASLIVDRHEKDRLAELNFLAGRKAKASIAYAPALKYLAAAAGLLPEDAWETRYGLAFPLFVEYAECAYLCGHHSRAGELFELATEKARTRADKAAVYSLRLSLYQVAGRYDDGVTVGLEALKMFGVTMPESEPEIQGAIEVEMRAAQTNLGARKIAELIDAPVVTDPEIKAVISLLGSLCPCAYIGRPMVFPWFILKMVNYSLTYGNTEESCFAYSVYGVLIVSAKGEIRTACELSEMSLKLNEKLNDPKLKGTLLHLHGDHINFWRRPFATGFPILDRAFQACIEVGDLVYAGFLAFETVWQVVEKGDPLDAVLTVSRKYAVFAQQSRNEAVYQTIRLEQQFVAALKGLTREPLSFDDESFDESACLAAIVQASFGCGVVFRHIMKQILAFTCGRYADALDFAAEAAKTLGAAMSMPIEATHYFYHALTLTALYPSAPVERQREFLEILKRHMQKLKLWADNCPENFLNRFSLVSAEFARITGKDLEAMRLYEQAIRSARENGFVQNEGIGYELAARFYRDRGFHMFADTCLREARGRYVRWGADGKVRQLDRDYPWIEEEKRAAVARGIGDQVGQLDAITVARASQAISGEIVLSDLLDTLMRTVIENAGAQKGFLILTRGDDLSVEAEAGVEGQEIKVVQPGASELASILPLSMANYVRRTRENVILDDASDWNMFSSDAYIVRNRPVSVLCLPVLRQANLVGLLYLENNLAKGAFTADRIAVLELLASQAAISLENAALYLGLRRAEEKFRGIFENIIEGIFQTSPGGRFIAANPALARMLGYESPEELMEAVTDMASQIYVDAGRRLEFMRLLEGQGSVRQFELQACRKDGGKIWVSLSGRAVRDTDGTLLYHEGTVEDITKRKEAEEEKAKLESQLLQAQKMEAVGRLAGGIAHDFNNLLTAINGYSDLLLSRLGESHPLRLDISEIRKAGERAASLTRQLLAFSRRQVLQPKVLDLNVLVTHLVEMLRRLIGEDIELVTVLDPCAGQIKADPGQIEQIVMNLAVNASDAMAGGGRLVIETANADLDESYARTHPDVQPGAYVMLAVSDTGCGMDEATKSHLFEPFFTTKEHGKGTGLGLATVYGIVRQSGGNIWVYSEPGVGTTFKIYLPRVIEVAELHENEKPSFGTLEGRESVLLVEDEELVRNLVHEILTSYGYTVLVARDGREALSVCERHVGPIALMVTDVVMPGMSGRELADRAAGVRPEMKVLFMSGYTENAIAHRGMLVPGTNLIQKPFRPPDLVRAVRKVLEEHRKE